MLDSVLLCFYFGCQKQLIEEDYKAAEKLLLKIHLFQSFVQDPKLILFVNLHAVGVSAEEILVTGSFSQAVVSKHIWSHRGRIIL